MGGRRSSPPRSGLGRPRRHGRDADHLRPGRRRPDQGAGGHRGASTTQSPYGLMVRQLADHQGGPAPRSVGGRPGGHGRAVRVIRILQKAGLSYHDVTPQNLVITNGEAALESGSVTATRPRSPSSPWSNSKEGQAADHGGRIDPDPRVPDRPAERVRTRPSGRRSRTSSSASTSPRPSCEGPGAGRPDLRVDVWGAPLGGRSGGQVGPGLADADHPGHHHVPAAGGQHLLPPRPDPQQDQRVVGLRHAVNRQILAALNK